MSPVLAGKHGYTWVYHVRLIAQYRASSTEEREKQGYQVDVVRPPAQDEPNAATVHAAVTRACINLDCDVTGPATV